MSEVNYNLKCGFPENESSPTSKNRDKSCKKERNRTPSPPFCINPTAQRLPELRGELLNDTVGLHVEHMVLKWIAGHELQWLLVSPVHSDCINLNPWSSCSSRHLLDLVLRTSVSDNDGNLWDVLRFRTRSCLFCEGFIHGFLDGHTSHGSLSEGFDAVDGLLYRVLREMVLQQELNFDRAGIVYYCDTCGIRANVKSVHHVSQEDLDLLKLTWTHATWAVNDVDQVQWAAPTLWICCWESSRDC